MISGEYVMAVLCAPLTARDLLQAEKLNNVFIMRRLEYDVDASYFSERAFAPYKLMFVFSRQEAIVVRSRQDMQEVQRRLAVAIH